MFLLTECMQVVQNFSYLDLVELIVRMGDLTTQCLRAILLPRFKKSGKKRWDKDDQKIYYHRSDLSQINIEGKKKRQTFPQENRFPLLEYERDMYSPTSK